MGGLKDGAHYLAKEWNQAGNFARGEFQGKVIAYVLFQISLAAVVPQMAAANAGKYAPVFKAVVAVDKYSSALDLSLDAVKGLRKVASGANKTGKATGATGRIARITEDLDDAKGAASRGNNLEGAQHKGLKETKSVDVEGPDVATSSGDQLRSSSGARYEESAARYHNPGPGARHAGEVADIWIQRDLFAELQRLAGKADTNKFKAALKKGIVGPTGETGVKILREPVRGFTHELKIGGSAQRLLGKVDHNGVLVFSEFVRGGLH